MRSKHSKKKVEDDKNLNGETLDNASVEEKNDTDVVSTDSSNEAKSLEKDLNLELDDLAQKVEEKPADEAVEETKEEVINSIKAEQKAKEEQERQEVLRQKQNAKSEILKKKQKKKEDEKKARQEAIQAKAEKRAMEKSQSADDKLLKSAEKRRAKIVNNGNISKKLRKKLGDVVRIEAKIDEGLTQSQVDERINQGLNNFQSKGSTKTIPQIVFGNIFTLFNILIFAIAGWLISIRSIKDLTFLVIVLANLIIGIIQEISAKNTIDRLSLISAPTCDVIRDGKSQEVGINEIVLDDLLVLSTGKQISADSIIVEGRIEVNESLLTGEADAIVKKPGDTLLSGSFVVSGQCVARVDKVGSDNYIEQLTGQAKQYKKPNSEILKALKKIIVVMGIIVILTGAGLFYTQYILSGLNYVTAVRKTAGAMIGMIPSGLYLVTTVALAVGVIRLGRSNVLVQELYCIEMLARIDVLCLDKTGTITDGSMSVKNVIDYNVIDGLTTKNIISALLNATNDNNMTSVALETKFGRGKRIKHNEVLPFSSQRKYSAATFEKYGTFAIGAAEYILKDRISLIKQDVERQAKEGYRVLLIAHSKDSIANGELPHKTLEPVALVLIEDNVRPDAVQTINYFKNSGVEVKVISGDDPVTVSKIAERAGIENADTYISLDGLTDLEVVRAASKFTVFGRVSPSQKRLLVQTLQELGHKVAMTGDGVNDILALKEADCSIAVASGSEAARNVSHLVLIDSNFNSMPKVVAEGRRVISNVSKVAKLYLTKTIFSLLLAIEGLIRGSYPISTNQLLMIDFLCIGLPSMILILEPNNNRAPDHFLRTIIKSAIPGAVAILIQSSLVFTLQDAMDFSSRVSSTIIVITATFTCMMVLFETCKPFNNVVRKVLFGSVFTCFVFCTLLLPSYFDFAPISGAFSYYSKNEEIVKWETKDISISQGGYYTVDGKVLDGIYAKQTNTHTIRIENNMLIIDDTPTYYPPELPTLSRTVDNFYSIGGANSNILYIASSTYNVNVSVNGDISLDVTDTNGYTTNIETGYNILPTVTISNNYYYVNGNITTVRASSEIVGKVYLSGYKVFAGGIDLNYNLYDEEGLLLGVDKDNKILVDVEKSTVAYSSFDANLTIDRNCNYLINGEDCGVDYKPEIGATKEGYYIIDGYISEYKAKGDGKTITQSLSEDGYLKINGDKTNIYVEHTISYGGQVSALPINSLILLVCLCLASHPLISLVRGCVPFTKKQIKKVSDLLNKI